MLRDRHWLGEPGPDWNAEWEHKAEFPPEPGWTGSQRKQFAYLTRWAKLHAVRSVLTCSRPLVPSVPCPHTDFVTAR